MIQLVLSLDDFDNNKFSYRYGNREVLFIVVDEEFSGINMLGRINRLIIWVVKEPQGAGGSDAMFCRTIIGMGDDAVGIKSGDASLHGKVITKDNMAQCTIELYEDDDA